jgi:polar amino acid transport system substrate-binding protein
MWMVGAVNASESPVTIQVVTEEAFPSQYIENGRLVGPSYDIVKAVLKEANIAHSVEVMPWARSYHMALTTANVLIFSMARTAQREQEFIWIGPLVDVKYYFYGLKQRFAGENLTLAQAKRLKIGVIRSSATYQYLQSTGFNNLYRVSSPKQNYEKLLTNRIDIFPANKGSFAASCRKFEINCEDIVPLRPLDLPALSLFFALSKETDPELVSRITRAYQHLIALGKISI